MKRQWGIGFSGNRLPRNPTLQDLISPVFHGYKVVALLTHSVLLVNPHDIPLYPDGGWFNPL